MSPRVRRSGDHVRLDLEEFELELLRTLPEEVRSLLVDEDSDDPAYRRLFPACAPDEEDVDAEVRRLIHDDVLRERLDGLDAVAEILERAEPRRGRHRVELDEEEAALFLGVLNDVRLTLGARIGMEHIERTDIDPDHPAASTLAVMDHLAWMQESILRVVDPPSVA